MADYSDPKRGVAFRYIIGLFAKSNNQLKTSPTIAAGDFKISKDGGATANLTTLPAETPAGSGMVQLDLSATEMTCDIAAVTWVDAAGSEWNSGLLTLTPSTVQMADLATAAALTTVDDFLDTEIAAIKAKTDNLPSDPADASDIASSFSTVNSTLSTIAGYIDTEVSTIVTQTSAASIRTAVGLASANLDTQIGTLATAANLTTVAGYLDTEVAAILADTNELQTDWADGGRLDLLIDAINAKTTNLPSDPADASVIAGRFDTLDTSVADLPTNAELATALGTADDAVLAQVALVKAKTDLIPAAPAAVGDIPSAATIADAVWDEAIAGHAGAGSTGEQLAAAGSAGDPWSTALPGAYGAGTAGKLIGDNINAPIATVDTVVDAIKAKTDSLTFTVAGHADVNLQYVNDVQVTGTGASGDEWGP